MDPITAFGATAAVFQLAQLSAQLLSKGYGFLAQVAHAPTEIQRLLVEAAALNVLFGQLETLPNTPPYKTATESLADTGVLEECKKILEVVNLTLGEYDTFHRKGLEKFGHRLLWPKREKEIKDAMTRLSRLHDIISAVIQTASQ